jgi:hypothetical protein
MVVLCVASTKRLKMRRPNLFSSVPSLLKMSFAGAFALAFIISCSDSTGPSLRFPASVQSVYVDVPDSLKSYWLNVSDLTVSGDVAFAPRGAALSVADAPWKYSLSHPDFAPEAYPRIVVPRESWLNPAKPAADGDGYITDVPLGFNFDFYGNTYDRLNVYANGFVSFGAPQEDPAKAGFFKGAGIPSTALPKNIIAFAWTDWSPQKVDNGVMFETRGDAPHRRFLLQFNNVPEYSSSGTAPGLLMMQLVLEEGTNVITIYTNTLKVTNSSQRITQGIENAEGTAARFDSIVNPINGVVSARVRNMFSLTNDAVRFSPPRPPTVTAPANLSIQPSSGSCLAASVNVGMATATDDIGVVSIVGVRSDDPSLALDAPYPSGVTTITWTATDTDGMTDRQSQTVTVSDKESPSITAPDGIVANNDPHLPSAVVATGSPSAKDNCSDVAITSSRSDGALADAPFMVGVTKITWKATDASGNSSSAEQSITVRDVEAPTIVVPANFVVNATSLTGAIVNYNLKTADNVGVVSIVCSKISGTGFPMGDTYVECTVSDAAGNSVEGGFVVSVLNAQLQMQNLLDYLYGLGAPSGGANPLANQVSAALNASLTDNHVACVKMNDFISMAAKKARDFPAGSIPYMTDEANRILAVLGCSNTRSRG